MDRLADENYMFDCLLEDEEMICVRNYNIGVLDTEKAFEKYVKEGEEKLTDYALNSERMKKSTQNTRETLLDFMLSCSDLAQAMTGMVLFVYQKNKERISASTSCEQLTFRENEIQILLRLCSMTTRIEFHSSIFPENDYPTLEIFFDLSPNSLTLANIIEALKEDF